MTDFDSWLSSVYDGPGGAYDDSDPAPKKCTPQRPCGECDCVADPRI